MSSSSSFPGGEGRAKKRKRGGSRKECGGPGPRPSPQFVVICDIPLSFLDPTLSLC